MIKFSIPIFLHFRTQQVFLKYSAKFQSITNSITHVFLDFYFREITAAINFPCSKSGLRIDHFTVVCSVTWPLDGSEAGVDLVLIQTSLLL